MVFDPNAFNQASTFLNNLGSMQKHEILTVSSLQQVKDFAMNKGDSYLLLDPNADLLYIKELDSIGKSSIRIFGLIEKTDEFLSNNTPATISKSEYMKLLKRLELLEGKNAVDEQQPELDFSGK